MTLQVNKFYENTLIIILCIKKRNDSDLKTKPIDIANDTEISLKSIYNYIEDLEKKEVIKIIRKDQKRIEDIRLTDSALRDLYDQTLVVLQENIRLRVLRMIELSENVDDLLDSDLENFIVYIKPILGSRLVKFIKQQYSTVIPEDISEKLPIEIAEIFFEVLQNFNKRKGVSLP